MEEEIEYQDPTIADILDGMAEAGDTPPPQEWTHDWEDFYSEEQQST